MLLYVLVPSFFIWLVSQSYLYYRGHYPVRLFPIQALVLVCSVWLGIDAVDRDDPLLYVGFLVPIASSTLLVCSILRAPRCVPVLAALPVVGYAVLCVAFCLLDAAVSACVCGAVGVRRVTGACAPYNYYCAKWNKQFPEFHAVLLKSELASFLYMTPTRF